MNKEENNSYRAETDGFHGELFLPSEDKYPGKVLICFSGSDGKFYPKKNITRAEAIAMLYRYKIRWNG